MVQYFTQNGIHSNNWSYTYLPWLFEASTQKTSQFFIMNENVICEWLGKVIDIITAYEYGIIFIIIIIIIYNFLFFSSHEITSRQTKQYKLIGISGAELLPMAWHGPSTHSTSTSFSRPHCTRPLVTHSPDRCQLKANQQLTRRFLPFA